MLHYGGKKDIISLIGYTFVFYPIKNAEKTVDITTSMTDLYVNGSLYSKNSPTYTVASGGTITLSTTLVAIDNTYHIVGPEGAYYNYWQWNIYVNGELYQTYTYRGTSSKNYLCAITVSGNLEIEVEKKIVTYIVANYNFLPDFEYEDIEQDKELEIISCLYDDKRYWLDKKYLTTGATNHTSQEDLFQLEKYEIGSIEVQR